MSCDISRRSTSFPGRRRSIHRQGKTFVLGTSGKKCKYIIDQEVNLTKEQEVEFDPADPEHSPRSRISERLLNYGEALSEADLALLEGTELLHNAGAVKEKSARSIWSKLHRIILNSTDQRHLPWSLWKLSLLGLAPFLTKEEGGTDAHTDPDHDVTDSWVRYTREYLAFLQPFNIGIFQAPKPKQGAPGDLAFNAWGIVDEGPWKLATEAQKVAFAEHISMESRLGRTTSHQRIRDSARVQPIEDKRGLQPDPDPEDEGLVYVWDIREKFLDEFRKLLRHPRGAACQLCAQETMDTAELPKSSSLAGQGRITVTMTVIPLPGSPADWDRHRALLKTMVTKMFGEEPTILFGQVPSDEVLESKEGSACYRPKLHHHQHHEGVSYPIQI